MNSISQLRADVASALGGVAGLSVFDFIPEAITAPAALVTPGNPYYVTPGLVLGEMTVSLNVRLFADGTNEVVTKALDELIVNVCEALRGYGVQSVSTPGIDQSSYAQPYLVTDITIESSI